jgi:hypothetical protein
MCEQAISSPRYMDYAEAREHIVSGDVLLFRWRSRFSLGRAISIAGRGVHAHVGVALWHRESLLLAEVREFLGGRLVLLSHAVRGAGDIDVARLGEHCYDPRNIALSCRAAARMVRFAGLPYGWRNVLNTAMCHLVGARLACRPSLDDDEEPRGTPFCSEAVARAYREVPGGVDLVPNLADRFTEPADLARSSMLQYVCTIRGGRV